MKSNKIVRYYSSGGNWSTHYDACQIINNLPKPIAEITTSHLGIEQGVFHYGGISHAVNKKGKIKWPKSNVPIIMTWYHILDDDHRIKLIPEMDERVSKWHSTCQFTLNTLAENGVSQDKLHLIPLGVDLDAFKPISIEERNRQRQALSIPEDAFVIGSFQKDALGWADGVKPKLEKGPDIFCDTIEKVAKEKPVFILLSGPARGYVKQRLDAANIPYHHTGYLDSTEDIAKLFPLLDTYLVASRIEGGPKAILESLASGIPLVTSKVGMAPDILTHNKNALISDIEDSDALSQNILTLIDSKHKREALSEAGIQLAQQYSWKKIAARYYSELYQPLL
ncbi:MAG: glycosyltransferase family 4 protein [Cellvibrionales bacterium]|nr:glycosyltransferase family 4 protein [Cellvibrionales bacterium]